MTEWQQITWNIFHTISLNYNEQYRDEYINFFNSMKVIIPCKICRNHYIDNLNKPNMNIESNMNKNKIFNWTVDLHNIINKKHNKKLWTHDDAKKYYQENNFDNKILKFFIFEFIRTNYKKNPEKTGNLIIMIKSLPYFHPNIDKRNKLIDFKNKFDLTRKNIKNWIYAFLIILKS